MIADPVSRPVGIPNEWIADSAFGPFFLSGLFLSPVNGLGQLLAAALAFDAGPLGAAAIKRKGELR